MRLLSAFVPARLCLHFIYGERLMLALCTEQPTSGAKLPFSCKKKLSYECIGFDKYIIFHIYITHSHFKMRETGLKFVK
jgi:hypothetical protein